MKKNSPKDYAIALYQTTNKLSGKALNEAVVEFVKLLAGKQKLKQAEKIIAEFLAYAKKQEGIQDIAITSAHKLDAKTSETIAQVFGKQVEATHAIDESLLGGFIVKTEDKIFDASLKTQLVRLKQSLQ